MVRGDELLPMKLEDVHGLEWLDEFGIPEGMAQRTCNRDRSSSNHGG